jgi:hypothetical protein
MPSQFGKPQHRNLHRKGKPRNPVVKKKQARDARLQSSCGALKSDGTECKRVAGWGTTHIGIGRCHTHSGDTPALRKNAIVQEAAQFMGAPMDINPFDAIIWCIRITAGEVAWLSTKIAEVDKEGDWFEDTHFGKQMHILQRTRADAQDRLVRYSRDAIQLGLAERAVRLAENFGVMLARLLENIAADLELSRKQKEIWPTIVRRQLILMEGGTPPESPDIIDGEVIDADQAA